MSCLLSAKGCRLGRVGGRLKADIYEAEERVHCIGASD